MSLFAVTDIHSHYTLMMKALEEKGFFKSDDNKLILLGDALDRGEEAQKTADFLVDLKRQGRLIFILGNHEDLLVQCLQKITVNGAYCVSTPDSHHFRNKTFDTILQLSGMSAKDVVQYPTEAVRAVMATDFYRELLPFGIDYYETKTHVFCHGWIPCIVEGVGDDMKAFYDNNWRDADIDRWKRARWLNGTKMACNFNVREPGKTIVCGHYHASWGHSQIDKTSPEWGSLADHSPFYADGIIAMDACTAVSGIVNCLVFEE